MSQTMDLSFTNLNVYNNNNSNKNCSFKNKENLLA